MLFISAMAFVASVMGFCFLSRKLDSPSLIWTLLSSKQSLSLRQESLLSLLNGRTIGLSFLVMALTIFMIVWAYITFVVYVFTGSLIKELLSFQIVPGLLKNHLCYYRILSKEFHEIMTPVLTCAFMIFVVLGAYVYSMEYISLEVGIFSSFLFLVVLRCL
jgi:hypothetical protein